MGTDWFNEHIVEPTVSDLVLPYVAEPYNELVQSLLAVVGLQSYASRVPDCKIKAPGRGR